MLKNKLSKLAKINLEDLKIDDPKLLEILFDGRVNRNSIEEMFYAGNLLIEKGIKFLNISVIKQGYKSAKANKNKTIKDQEIIETYEKVKDNCGSIAWNMAKFFKEKNKPRKDIISFYEKVLRIDYEPRILTKIKEFCSDEEIILLFENVLSLEPNNKDLLISLSNQYMELKSFEKALVILEKLNLIEHNDVFIMGICMCLKEMYVALIDAEKYDEALYLINKSLKYDSNNVETISNLAVLYSNKGNVLSSKGKYDEAIGAYEKAITINPKFVDAYTNLAGLYCDKLGNYKKAIEVSKQAISVNSKFYAAYNNLGFALYNLGNLSEAVQAYSKSLELKSDSKHAHGNLGSCLLKLSENKDLAEIRRQEFVEKAEYHLIQAANQNSLNAQYYLGVLYYRKWIQIEDKQSEQAINLYKKVEKLFHKAANQKDQDAQVILKLLEKLKSISFNENQKTLTILEQLKIEEHDTIEEIKHKIVLQDTEESKLETLTALKPDISLLVSEKELINKDIERTISKKKKLYNKPSSLKKNKIIDKGDKQESISNRFKLKLEKDGFKTICHHTNNNSSLYVKIDFNAKDIRKLNPEFKESFSEVAKNKGFVGSVGQQGYKVIKSNVCEKFVELKLTRGKNAKGNNRLWGPIIKDEKTGVKFCLLSYHGKHR